MPRRPLINQKIGGSRANQTGEIMIIENPEEKKELDKIPNVDENGDPICKIDEALNEKSEDELPDVGDSSNSGDESEFKDTLQDLKNTTSQE
jgi:hypothetical protein